MMPLWMTEIAPTLCGWAFSSDGRPWVAQRVWPMPIVPGAGSLVSLSSRFASLPRQRTTRLAPLDQTLTPAESYPRYSSLRNPPTRSGVACRPPTYPTMPHMGYSPPSAESAPSASVSVSLESSSSVSGAKSSASGAWNA
jgi:hypothetical protein